jgi:hypothetical protein
MEIMKNAIAKLIIEELFPNINFLLECKDHKQLQLSILYLAYM